MSRKKLKCDTCGVTKSIDYLFRCYYCAKVCCEDHTSDDIAMCTKCRENEEDE
jgi:hypothetical protein